MPVSSLIFVVILAVWAVYLVQHWVRRRDHLATARSVDRFSESMRVLERRRALPRPDLSEPAPRSYSVSPLRPARPEVVVKHVPAGATAVAKPVAVRRARTAARLRAAGLLFGSVTMVTLVALSLTKTLPPWAALVGVVVMAASVSVVRLSAARGRSGSQPVRRSAPTARPATTRTTIRRATRTSAARPAAPAAAVETGVTAAPALAPQHAPEHAFARQSVAVTTRRARRTVQPAALYDIDQVESTLAVADAPAAAVEPMADQPVAEQTVAAQPVDAQPVATQLPAGSWEPVPVPPPTYTLKAKAYRPTYTGTQLPADGTEMALEEEFEDLPRIESVG